MPRGQILLLGPPQVLAGGQLVNIERRVNRGILYFLASLDHPVSRSELLTYFWRETSEKDAHARLSESLSRLSALLPGFLLKDTRQVSLNNDLVYVDQSQFTNLVAEIGDHPWKIPRDHPLPSILVNKIVEAASLWRGMHYLGGKVLSYSVELEDWFYLTSHQLESQHVRLLLRLAEHHLICKAYEECQSILYKALQIDRLNKELFACLLNCLLDQGKVIEAREQYKQMVSTFQREGYLDFPTSLEEYLAGFQETIPTSTGEEIKIAWNRKNDLDIPFVGRKEPLEQLHRTYLSGGEIIILGEPGLGKTRLVQEFIGQLIPQPRLILMNCRSGEETLPYQPIIDCFRHYLSQEDWKALPPVWSGPLSLLLPEIMEYIAGDIAQSVRFGSDTPLVIAQERLLEAIRQVFIRVDNREQMVFCLDDAQWADEATLATFNYLITRPPLDKHLKIIIARSDEISPVLQRVIDQLLKKGSCQLLELAYLGQNEMEELFKLSTGKTASQEIVIQLSHASRSNPLYLVEIFHLLQENQVHGEGFNLDKLPLGASIRSLVLSRQQSISAMAREVLQTASIIGVEFSTEMISEIHHQNLETMLPLLEELQNNQFIEIIPESSGKIRCQFIHKAIREILVQGINTLRRQKLEQTIAFKLETNVPIGNSSQSAILAQHYEQAGEGVRAFEKWVQAGQYARMLFSLREAEIVFARAESLIALIPEIPEQAIYDLYTEWAEMYADSEDAKTVEELSQRLEVIAREKNNLFLMGTSLNIRCQAFLILNQFKIGQDISEYTLRLLENEPTSVALIDALCHLGMFLMMQGQFKQALPFLDKAASLAHTGSSRTERRVRATAHSFMAYIQFNMAMPILALQNAQMTLDENIENNRQFGLVFAYNALAWSNYYLGKLDQARCFCNLGLELANRMQAFRMLGYLHAIHAMLDFEFGDLDSLYDHTDKIIQYGEQHQHPDITSLGYRIRGDGLSVMGGKTATEYYQTALSIGKEGIMYLGTIAQIGLAKYLSGNTTEGRALVQEAIQLAEITGLEIIGFQAKTAYYLIRLLEKEWQSAITSSQELIQVSRERGLKPIELLNFWILGRAQLESGQVQSAITSLKYVVEQAEYVPYAWLAIEAIIDLHKAYRQIGKVDSTLPAKLHDILKKMGENIQKPGLKEAFETYKDEKLTHVI